MKASLFSAIIMASISFSTPVLASGTVSAGGQGMDAGQKIYMQKITCSSCPYAGGVQDMAQAKQALSKISSGEIKLKDAEKKAVTKFIKRRFKGA